MHLMSDHYPELLILRGLVLGKCFDCLKCSMFNKKLSENNKFISLIYSYTSHI